MNKLVTKTSAQARMEQAKQRKDTACPECGGHCLGLVSTRSTGFWYTKTERRNEYTCIECKCEWATPWSPV